MIPLTAKEVESVLKRNGYELARSVGSHFHWINLESRKLITVPHHGNAKLQQGTLKSIVRQTGLAETEFHG